MVSFCLTGIPPGADVDGITAATHRGRYSLRENSEAFHEESERRKRWRVPPHLRVQMIAPFSLTSLSFFPQKAVPCPTPPFPTFCRSCFCSKRAPQQTRPWSRGRLWKPGWMWSCSTLGRPGPLLSKGVSTALSPRPNSKVGQSDFPCLWIPIEPLTVTVILQASRSERRSRSSSWPTFRWGCCGGAEGPRRTRLCGTANSTRCWPPYPTSWSRLSERAEVTAEIRQTRFNPSGLWDREQLLLGEWSGEGGRDYKMKALTVTDLLRARFRSKHAGFWVKSSCGRLSCRTTAPFLSRKPKMCSPHNSWRIAATPRPLHLCNLIFLPAWRLDLPPFCTSWSNLPPSEIATFL